LGTDDKGRDILSYIEGEVPAELGWHRDEVLVAAAQLIRKFHDATVGLLDRQAGTPRRLEVVCHNDLSPCNFVFRAGIPIALIDFDTVAPGPRLRSVALARSRRFGDRAHITPRGATTATSIVRGSLQDRTQRREHAQAQGRQHRTRCTQAREGSSTKRNRIRFSARKGAPEMTAVPQPSARPGGSTGTSRARRRVSCRGTPRRARVPPVDYRDGLSPCQRNPLFPLRASPA